MNDGISTEFQQLPEILWSTDLVEWSSYGVRAEQLDPETGDHYQTWTVPSEVPNAFGRLRISE